MKIKSKLATVFVILFILGTAAITPSDIARAGDPVVRAVLFYSPSCPHCHKVINEDLPPLFEKYGDQLAIIGINVSTQEGQALYQSAVSSFDIPENRRGVPCLIVDDTVLVGSLEIPQQIPKIIEQGLISGGIDWPDIPGLETALESEQQGESTNAENEVQENSQLFPSTGDPADEPNPSILPGTTASIGEKIKQDPAGNTVSIVVLVGMITSVLGIGLATIRTAPSFKPAEKIWPSWLIPLLSVIGLLIAVYLSYIEFSLTEAICGPIGDCTTVQQSKYARLFSVLPIGVLGAVGYVAILITWTINEFGASSTRKISSLGLWGFAWIGTLFSIYLTFLEPFVIGATCMWCVSSAVIMTLLLWASTGPAIKQLRV